MESANRYCFVPRSEEEKVVYHEQVRQKVTANVVRITFDDVKVRSEDFIEGSPIFCSSCQASVNTFSIVSCQDGNTVWNCEFCGYQNQLEIPYKDFKNPSKSDQFYMLQRFQKNQVGEKGVDQTLGYQMMSESSNEEEVDMEDKRTVIFCLDNSGSMSSGTSFKNEFGESKYMSRKQCVEKAIINQINHMQKNQPNRKAGIVLFSKDVLILGDCSNQSIQISKEGSFEKLFEQGQNSYGQMFNMPIGKVATKGESNEIAMKYKETRTNGTTALGPGLAISLGLASQSEESGAMIVLCTDGLANEGIGKLEDARDVQTYERMGQFAKSQGILIHTITMRGMESDVRVLGQLATETGGKTSRLGPSDFDKNFVELLKSDLVASQVEIVFQLHEGLRLIEGEPHTDIGNATSDTRVTFQYAVKEDYDFKNLSSIPLQVKIFLKTQKGDKMVRIITLSQDITSEKKVANTNIKIDILAGHAQKSNARKVQYFSANEAEVDNNNWNVFMENEVFTNNTNQEQEKLKYQARNQKLTRAIQYKQAPKKDLEINEALDCEDMEQDLFDLYY